MLGTAALFFHIFSFIFILLVRPDRPAHLRRAGTRVLYALLRGRAHHIFGIFFIDTGAISLFERRFHQFILSGMEGQDRCPSARSKRIWKLLHKLIEYFKFLVYIDPERLENTLTGLLDCLLFLLFRKEIQCFFNDFTEFRGRIDPISTADLIRDRFCQLLAVRFV